MRIDRFSVERDGDNVVLAAGSNTLEMTPEAARAMAVRLISCARDVDQVTAKYSTYGVHRWPEFKRTTFYGCMSIKHDVPYSVVRVGSPKEGEFYLSATGTAQECTANWPEHVDYMLIVKEEKDPWETTEKEEV